MNDKMNDRLRRLVICLMLITCFFLTAWLINSWQSDKVNASIETHSTVPKGIKIKAIQDVEVGERALAAIHN